MRILILGGSGMLGHQLLLNLQLSHRVQVTLRKEKEVYHPFNIFNDQNSYWNLDIRNLDRLSSILAESQPDTVINAVGIVKQHNDADKTEQNLEINALFPHQLAFLCAKFNTRLIHLSSDCIFSGNKGSYSESDMPDATDLYGRCKYLGEVNSPNTVTIRASFIGQELLRKKNLLEWFLSQRGKIKGYRNAIFSGFTTYEMSNVVSTVLNHQDKLTGVWHVASDPISKYDLLSKLAELLQRTDVEIEQDDHFLCDRSLSSEAFNKITGYKAPKWDAMLKALVDQIQTNRLIKAI
jgi:dTDP-4-dehydrorhamnose reductase